MLGQAMLENWVKCKVILSEEPLFGAGEILSR